MGKRSSVEFQASDYLSPRFWPMWGVIGLMRLAALLPYRGGLAAGRLLGRIVYLVAFPRKRIARINLARCFPEKSPAERRRIEVECFESMGISMFEMAICWWWPEDKLKPMVEIEGRARLDAAMAGGRGAILLGGHFTSIEIGGRLLAMLVPVQAMYRTQRNQLLDSFLYTRRSRYAARAVSRKQTRQLIKGIREGFATWYAPDQDFRRERNVFAPFMGIPTATLTAGSRLALATGAAMLPFYTERKADGSGYVLHIDPPLENFPSGDDLADATAINAAIEKYVRRFPQTYMWVHQRFKTRPPGEAPFYP